MSQLNEETSTRLYGNWSIPEAEIISNAWLNALAIDHKLSDEVKRMEGMSGRKYRYFINNLIETMPNPRYLEIGSHSGSTACSAIYGNKLKITCIDNWSEFGGPKDLFMYNINAISGPDVDFTFIENDFKKIDYNVIGKHNIYMFDGPHSEQDHYDGIKLVEPALDDQYILIVDDYNWEYVRQNTEKALETIGHTILSKIEILTSDGHASISHQHSDWHNGYFIGLIKK